MRRKDREITELNEKLELIKQCKTLRLAMSVNDRPYIVPLNFGWEYKDNTLLLYIHSAKKGRKIDTLSANANICIEMDIDHGLITGNIPCEHSYRFQSLIGSGTAVKLESNEQKAHALTLLMQHQTNNPSTFTFPQAHLDAVAVYQLIITEWSGKQHL